MVESLVLDLNRLPDFCNASHLASLYGASPKAVQVSRVQMIPSCKLSVQA